jgi:hypothetical protein
LAFPGERSHPVNSVEVLEAEDVEDVGASLDGKASRRWPDGVDRVLSL